MEFTVNGSKIVCSRVQKTKAGEHRRDIVEFDTQLNTVPTHVASRLLTPEIQQLKQFLADRQRLQARPESRIILEALPGLIDKVRGVLDSVEQIDGTLHQQLTNANDRLSTALTEVPVVLAESEPRLQSMSTSEALKQRLGIIKDEI